MQISPRPFRFGLFTVMKRKLPDSNLGSDISNVLNLGMRINQRRLLLWRSFLSTYHQMHFAVVAEDRFA